MVPMQEEMYRRRWVLAVDDAIANLTSSSPSGLLYITTRVGRHKRTQMEHLSCFFPGSIALGIMEGAVAGAKAEQYLDIAEKLTYSCWQMYQRTKTGQPPGPAYVSPSEHRSDDSDQEEEDCIKDSPARASAGGVVMHGPACVRCSILMLWGRAGLGLEIAEFSMDAPQLRGPAVGNRLRPETVESLFYLWRATGKAEYRDWGWAIFEAFVRHSRTPEGAFASVQVPFAYTQGLTVSCPHICCSCILPSLLSILLFALGTFHPCYVFHGRYAYSNAL